jgi:hypothetical protein
MNVWLVTLGSSDVQIKDADVWGDWYQEIKRSIHGIDRKAFTPTRTHDDEGVPYRMAARVLGMAYEKLGSKVTEQLKFPLLEQFQQQLLNEVAAIDQIVVLTSDQTAVFNDDNRASYRCPYWQDTGLLYPIVAAYLQTQFPAAQISPLALSPAASEQGLDDWDAVLKLVRHQIASLNLEPEKVYVSHQAGTPAISSAVQFASLAKFGDRVEFLVSSEYRPDRTRMIDSSAYLGALRLQEAKALLDRYDYAGVERLLGNYLDPKQPQQKRMKILLEAAIEWNHAEFHKFKNKLIKSEMIPKDAFPWWRSGYESAYLAWVRLQQENTVEALFHSFRGLEGTILAWAKHTVNAHLQEHPKYGIQLKESIVTLFPKYKAALSDPNQKKLDKYGNIGLFGDPLYELLRQAKPDWKENGSIQIVWEEAKDQRNSAFHTIEGLQKEEVFRAWNTENAEDWAKRILSCLNFVTDQTFTSLAAASLMTQLHEDLKSAITDL